MYHDAILFSFKINFKGLVYRKWFSPESLHIPGYVMM
jgi:hypothetical protein